MRRAWLWVAAVAFCCLVAGGSYAPDFARAEATCAELERQLRELNRDRDVREWDRSGREVLSDGVRELTRGGTQFERRLRQILPSGGTQPNGYFRDMETINRLISEAQRGIAQGGFRGGGPAVEYMRQVELLTRIRQSYIRVGGLLGVDSRRRVYNMPREVVLRSILHARYQAQGCGDPPDDCQPEVTNDGYWDRLVRGLRNLRGFRRQAGELFEGLLSPAGLGGSPVRSLARIDADGWVLDWFSGNRFESPVSPGEALRVTLRSEDPNSPFRANQTVSVGILPVRGASGELTQLAQFFDLNSGQQLMWARGPDAGSTPVEFPTVQEQFPHGLFLIPTVPSGVVAPLSGQAVPAGVRSVLEVLRRLLESAGPLPVPTASRDGGAGRGCFAEFVRGGVHAIGVNCSREAPYGRWTWRVAFDGWASAKFTETVSRNGAWSAHSEAQVTYHRYTPEQLAAMDPIRRNLEQQLKPQFQAGYKSDIEAWEVRITGRNQHRTLQWRKPGLTEGDGIPNMWRTRLQAGCDQQAPAAYKGN